MTNIEHRICFHFISILRIIILSRCYAQCRLNAWARRAVARGPESIEARANLCMLCMAYFFKRTNAIIYLALSTFTVLFMFHVSGCVGRDPSALLCPGPYNAVKTTLILRIIILSRFYAPAVI